MNGEGGAAARSAYHISGVLALQGALDITALQAALDAIVARHESLRTCFVADAQGRGSPGR